MFYIVIILILLTLGLLMNNYMCRFTYPFIIMVTALVVTTVATYIYISKIGYYPRISNFFLYYDYKIFLWSVQLDLSYRIIFRIMNIGIAVFLLMVPIFIASFTGFSPFNLNKWILTLVLLPFPVFYVIYNDISTIDYFNITILQISSEIERIKLINILKSVDIFNFICMLAYLFAPLYYCIKNYRCANLSFKRKQIISVFISQVCLNILFIIGVSIVSQSNIFEFSDEVGWRYLITSYDLFHNKVQAA